jgi:hypothetical protein
VLPFKRSTRIGVILQTTWHMSLARDVIAQLVSEFREVKVIDTACIDSLGRVPAARKIAAESDVVVIVDIGKVARYLEGARPASGVVRRREESQRDRRHQRPHAVP